MCISCRQLVDVHRGRESSSCGLWTHVEKGRGLKIPNSCVHYKWITLWRWNWIETRNSETVREHVDLDRNFLLTVRYSCHRFIQGHQIHEL